MAHEKIEGISYDRTNASQKNIDTDGDGIITAGEATITPANNNEVLAGVMDQHHNEPDQIRAFLQRITAINPKRGDEIFREYMKYGKFSEIKQVLWTPSSSEPRLECTNDPRMVDNVLTYSPHRTEAGGGVGQPQLTSAPEGKLITTPYFMDYNEEIRRQAVAHELFHHRWDHLSGKTRKEIIDTFRKNFSIEQAVNYLRKKSLGYHVMGLAGMSYEDRFNEMMKYYGPEVAYAFVINETLAPWVSYHLVPLSVPPPLFNQPSPDGMKDLIKEMGSAENVRKECEKAGIGWRLPVPGNEDEGLWILANHEKELTLGQKDFLFLRSFGFAESPDMIALLDRHGLIPKKSEIDNTYAKLIALIRQNECVP